jgi:uncharacterized protein
MPNGKPAGEKCIHLSDTFSCLLFYSETRPKVCGGFKAEILICGNSRHDAISNLAQLEGIEISDNF